MEIATIAMSIPFGFMFLLSGLLINFIQAICFILIRPLSKETFRRINGAVAQILWLEILWLMEWWSGFKLQLYTDSETYQLMGKEHALLMPNHISDVDVLISWLLALRSGCLDRALMVVKKSTKFLPIYGWAAWFFEFVFLDRNWEKDESKMKSSFQVLRDFKWPFWLTIFVEGTRLTHQKLESSQEFAISTGRPVPRNVMIPRTKGFVLAVQQLRSFVPAIYDVTLAVPTGHPIPSFMGFLRGHPFLVKVHIKRYTMKELPESDEGIAQWCRDRFVVKDALLDKFYSEDTFKEGEKIEAGPSKKSLRVYVCGYILIILGAVKLCKKYSLFSTGRGRTIIGLCFAMTILVLHVFIEFTKPPAKQFSPIRTKHR